MALSAAALLAGAVFSVLLTLTVTQIQDGVSLLPRIGVPRDAQSEISARTRKRTFDFHLCTGTEAPSVVILFCIKGFN